VLSEEDIYKDFMDYAKEVRDELEIYLYMRRTVSELIRSSTGWLDSESCGLVANGFTGGTHPEGQMPYTHPRVLNDPLSHRKRI
jgi:hypothetical protein